MKHETGALRAGVQDLGDGTTASAPIKIFFFDSRQWEFRFSRCSQSTEAKWRPLPWCLERHSVFWMACFVAEGRNYLHLGLDDFPEKRFFSARLARLPKAVGFGPSQAAWEHG